MSFSLGLDAGPHLISTLLQRVSIIPGCGALSKEP